MLAGMLAVGQDAGWSEEGTRQRAGRDGWRGRQLGEVLLAEMAWRLKGWLFWPQQ